MGKIDVVTISKISCILFLFILAYFAYVALTTQPTEGDSLAYHIPIAQSLANGAFFHPPEIPLGLGYYPAASEGILALFIVFGVPLNLYNVLGLIFLFFACKRLGVSFGLGQYAGLLFAVSVCTLPSVLRGIPVQTVDIWLAVFFVGSLILLQKPKKSLSYFLKLGFMIGMLIGSKASGPLFAMILLILYGRKLLLYTTTRSAILCAILIAFFGLSWYVRNYVLTGNPFYPASIFVWKGEESFQLLRWQPWKTILFYPGGMGLLGEALVSEFLIWSLSFLAVPLFLIYYFQKKFRISVEVMKLGILGFVNFIIYFFLPSWPQNIISDLRYIYPAMIPLMLVCFSLALTTKKIELLSILACATSFFVMPQLDYYPKLILVFLITVALSLFTLRHLKGV